MIVYLDTSAAFKLLAAEAESEPLAAALTALDPADVLLSSRLLFTELHCAAQRRSVWDVTAVNAVLEIQLDDELELANYEHNLRRMFGNERMDAVIGSVDGSVRFYGLTPTSMQLEGLDKHLRLIDSYKKLHAARAKAAGLAG